MDFINFNNHIIQTKINVYGGSEKKRTVILDDGKQYLLKFPDPTREVKREISYINNAISEYIGCKVFEQAGFDVQKVMLGKYTDERGITKITCACQDVRKEGEQLHDLDKIELSLVDENKPLTFETIIDLLDKIDDIDTQQVFEEYCNRFVIDALIGNTDRHNGNWGLIEGDGYLKIAPVYDCGSSLSPLYRDEELTDKVLANEMANVHSAIRENDAIRSDKGFHYRDYIWSCKNEDVNNAIRRILPKIKVSDIKEMIENIPYISEQRKNFYTSLISDRYNKILLPALEKNLDIKKTEEYKRWNSNIISNIYNNYLSGFLSASADGSVKYKAPSGYSIEYDYTIKDGTVFFLEEGLCVGLAKIEKSNLNVEKFVQSARNMDIPIDRDIEAWKRQDKNLVCNINILNK